MGVGLATAAVIGSLASAGSAMYASHQQKKAASSAAAAARDVADAATATATSTAAESKSTQSATQQYAQATAKRRMSVSSTVNKIYSNNGLRKTLN